MEYGCLSRLFKRSDCDLLRFPMPALFGVKLDPAFPISESTHKQLTRTRFSLCDFLDFNHRFMSRATTQFTCSFSVEV